MTNVEFEAYLKYLSNPRSVFEKRFLPYILEAAVDSSSKWALNIKDGGREVFIYGRENCKI